MSLSLSPTPARDAGEDTPIMFCARGGEGRGQRNRKKKKTLYLACKLAYSDHSPLTPEEPSPCVPTWTVQASLSVSQLTRGCDGDPSPNLNTGPLGDCARGRRTPQAEHWQCCQSKFGAFKCSRAKHASFDIEGALRVCVMLSSRASPDSLSRCSFRVDGIINHWQPARHGRTYD